MGRVFLFSKVHRLVTQIQRRTAILFDIVRSIATKSEVTRFLAVPLDMSAIFNDIHDTAGFLYGNLLA